ncbi:MAG: lipopolysaccharide heptosyltransferase II [Thiothrix nivea]|nr:MAG: lipopolysaccharide heptosyltransferase II [Thiothrix nivea]
MSANTLKSTLATKPATPEKCLIVGPSWIGDMVMAQSLFIYLKQCNPSLLIDVLAPKWSEPLLAAMPEVNASIVMPLGHGTLALRTRYRLGKSLRDSHYDQAIILPNSLKSALIPFWANIPRRTGYKGEMRYGLVNDIRHLDKHCLTMTVQRFVALGHTPHPYQQAPDFPAPALSLPDTGQAAILEKFRLSAEQPFIVLCPGAEYGSAKRWPEKYFAELANTLTAQGYRIVLSGSAKDRPVAQAIMEHTRSQAILDITGQTSLHEIIVILHQATAAVSNDSGLMHIAAAVNTPLVALYGSSDPSFTPPLSMHHAIINLGLECSPCFKRQCPLGTLACLTGIQPTTVAQCLEELISRKTTRHVSPAPPR